MMLASLSYSCVQGGQKEGIQFLWSLKSQCRALQCGKQYPPYLPGLLLLNYACVCKEVSVHKTDGKGEAFWFLLGKFHNFVLEPWRKGQYSVTSRYSLIPFGHPRPILSTINIPTQGQTQKGFAREVLLLLTQSLTRSPRPLDFCHSPSWH